MNEVKQKDPQALQSQTGHMKITSNSIIAENRISDRVLEQICDGDLAKTDPAVGIMRRLCEVSDLAKVG